MFPCNLCQKRNHSLVWSLRTRVLHSGNQVANEPGLHLAQNMVQSDSFSIAVTGWSILCRGSCSRTFAARGAFVPRNIWEAWFRRYPVFLQLHRRPTPVAYTIHTSDVSLPKCAPAIANFLKAFADQSLAVVEVPKGHRRGVFVPRWPHLVPVSSTMFGLFSSGQSLSQVGSWLVLDGPYARFHGDKINLLVLRASVHFHSAELSTWACKARKQKEEEKNVFFFPILGQY